VIALILLALKLLAAPFKSKSRLEAENAVLRHQLIVLRRTVHGRVQLSNADRLFFAQLYRWFPTILKLITVVRPETLGALASSRVSPLLALEVTPAGRSATDRRGATGVDPTHERGESSFGWATHSR
jgi:hypothetical protein